jgi:hypothetical protein
MHAMQHTMTSALEKWRERCHQALETRGPWWMFMPEWWLTGISLALLSAEKTGDPNVALELVSATLRDECMGSYQHNRRGLAAARTWLRESIDESLTQKAGEE